MFSKLLASASAVALLTLGFQINGAHATSVVDFNQDIPVILESATTSEQLAEEVKLDLSFNSQSTEAESGFLYFNDHTSAATSLSANSSEALGLEAKAKESFTPRFGESISGVNDLAVLGDDWLINSFTPRQADAHLSFGFNSSDKEDGSKLGIALSSSVKVDEVELPGVVNNPSLNSALNRQTYRLGLNVGYSGFNIGASLRGDQSAYADTTSGYGVGLSYSWSSWSTRLNVGEYSRKYRNVFGSFGQDEANFYTVEFGASYNLNRSFRLSGGVRYLTFGEENIYTFKESPESQVFYLGTKFSF